MTEPKDAPAVAHTTTRRIILAWGLLGATTSLASRTGAASPAPYGLDELPRTIPARGRVQCPKVDTVLYRGTHVPYQHAARIYVEFRPRLIKMEAVAVEAAKAVYGRAPRRLIHLGTYNCRRIGAYPTWLSEHGLGNAIDLAGFDFGPLPRGSKPPTDLPRALRGPFSVRVERHWKQRPGPTEAHSRFLRTIASRLLKRRDIFRVLLGPGYPGHHNHFHFDMAPYRLVDGFEDLDS